MTVSDRPPKQYEVRLGWFGRRWAACVLLGILVRGALHRRPGATSLAQRLRMLPLQDAPLRAPVSIRWNRYQIPAISAKHDEDLFVALGVVHAHLRLAQMELLRRLATGRLCEVVGPAALEIDHAVRLLDLPRAVPEILTALPEETRKLATRFVWGINHVIAHAKHQPYEFRVLSLHPEPWTIEDALAVQRLCSIDMSWNIWSRLLPLRSKLGAAAWRSLWPQLLRCGAPPTPVGRDVDPATASLSAVGRHGSNSMAVSGRRRSSGAALIASDPHLPYGLPSPWIAVSMRSPTFDCAGLMMPSQPFLALGRNRDIGWGGTSLHAQSSDLFDISAEPESRIGERRTIIRARGRGAYRIRLREHAVGPVVSDGVQFRARRPLAMRWLGHTPSDELSAMLGIARARDWQGFQACLSSFSVSGLNLVFADRAGHIGKLCAAHMPSRPDAAPPDIALPLSEFAAWDRIVNTDALPRDYDPAVGVVVSANARPVGGTVPVGFFFATPDRQDRIRERLLAVEDIDARQIQALQSDVASRWGRQMLRMLLPLLPSAQSEPERLLTRSLSAWDGEYATDSHGAVAFVSLIHALVAEINCPEALAAHEDVGGVEAFVRTALEECGDEEKPFLVAAAFGKAAVAYSPAVTWGEWHGIILKHPLSALPLIGKRFLRARVPAGGSNDTVCKSGHSFSFGVHAAHYGSCARHVADLSHPHESFVVQLGGQDGWIGSVNGNDETELWERDEMICLPLADACDAESFPLLTMLEPAQGCAESQRHS